MRFKFLEKINRRDSLKSKIYHDTLKGLFISFCVGYFIYFSVHIFSDYSFEDFIMETVFYILMSISILVIMDIILLRSVQKHVVDKLDFMGHELNDVKEGNLSKRLTIFEDDEIARRSIFINELLDELEKLVEHEKKYSLIDPLTSCYNRRALSIDIQSILSKTKRNNSNFILALIDLDDFKKVNDTYGHKVGDDVLVEFSDIVKNMVRSHDYLYRVGGEEFLLIMTDISIRGSKTMLERIRKKVPYYLKKNIAKLHREVTFSCGFVASKKYDLETKDILENMIVDADKLTYEAKRNGKDQIIN